MSSKWIRGECCQRSLYTVCNPERPGPELPAIAGRKIHAKNRAISSNQWQSQRRYPWENAPLGIPPKHLLQELAARGFKHHLQKKLVQTHCHAICHGISARMLTNFRCQAGRRGGPELPLQHLVALTLEVNPQRESPERRLDDEALHHIPCNHPCGNACCLLDMERFSMLSTNIKHQPSPCNPVCRTNFVAPAPAFSNDSARALIFPRMAGTMLRWLIKV